MCIFILQYVMLSLYVTRMLYVLYVMYVCCTIQIQAILKKAIAKDEDGKMEIDDFQDIVEDAMGQVYSGDKWADWFDDMVNDLDAELNGEE